MISELFTPTKSEFDRLDQTSGVEFIAKLLWAESRRINISVINISISRNVNVPDGGIDVEVKDKSEPQGELIRNKLSCFQIKTGKNFRPQEDHQIKKELFGSNKTLEKENLGEGVKRCLDQNGAYILVCPKQLLNPEEIRKAEENNRKNFELCGYHNVHIIIIDQTKLIGVLKRYPSLILELKGITNINFQTHSSWSNHVQMRKEFILGKTHAIDIEKVRQRLRDPIKSAHIRILGEPGIGKTKFALETTRSQDLSPLVIYFVSSKKFLNSGFLNYISLQDNDFTAILVIDECDLNDSLEIWNQSKSRTTD